jgi:hypothetical protein
VTVTGISRLHKVGSEYKRRISVRDMNDITPLDFSPAAFEYPAWLQY